MDDLDDQERMIYLQGKIDALESVKETMQKIGLWREPKKGPCIQFMEVDFSTEGQAGIVSFQINLKIQELKESMEAMV